MSNQQWLSTELDPEMIRARPITIKDKYIGDVKGHLEVENANEKGQVVVSAHYNSSPFAGTVSFAKFYLTQEQLDDFLSKGALCVLTAPKKVEPGIGRDSV